jgi:hypothetical protein
MLPNTDPVGQATPILSIDSNSVESMVSKSKTKIKTKLKLEQKIWQEEWMELGTKREEKVDVEGPEKPQVSKNYIGIISRGFAN